MSEPPCITSVPSVTRLQTWEQSCFHRTSRSFVWFIHYWTSSYDAELAFLTQLPTYPHGGLCFPVSFRHRTFVKLAVDDQFRPAGVTVATDLQSTNSNGKVEAI